LDFPFMIVPILPDSGLPIRSSHFLNANQGDEKITSQQSTCMPSLRTFYAGSGEHQPNWQFPRSCSVYMCSLRLK
jgi:hypothetical protein